MILPRTPSMRLEGKRALVVGASSGIGLGCAVALAEVGADVVLAARDETRLASMVEAFHAEGWKANSIPLDIANISDMRNMIADQAPFDVMVNSAGMARHGAALEVEPESFDDVCATNLRGAFFLSQAVAKKLIAAGRTGSLINISSQMGHVGGVDRSVYCATKHAVEGFTKAMAIEWGPFGIRINTVCPTFILTPLTASTFANPERAEWINSKIPLGRVGRVEDVMGVVQYLAGDAAALVTGSAFMVDGGWTAG